MRKIKSMKRWAIYQLTEKEKSEFGFAFAPIHPDVVGTPGLTPNDADWECNTLEEAEEWIRNY